jgi:hypothetical protein
VSALGPEAQIIDYGLDGENSFHAVVVIKNWQQYKDYKSVLITHTAFADRDRMTDYWIAKSIAYTIDGSVIRMVTRSNNQMHFARG